MNQKLLVNVNTNNNNNKVNEEDDDEEDDYSILTLQTIRDAMRRRYTENEYRFISAATYEGHFCVIDVTFDIRRPDVLQTVTVYDSSGLENQRWTSAILLKLQTFLSGICFHGLENNQVLLENPDYILQKAVYKRSPRQTNKNHDDDDLNGGLFAVVVIWHLLCDVDIHPTIFSQRQIDTFREALYHGLLSNPEWATMENISCYFPVLAASIKNKKNNNNNNKSNPNQEESSLSTTVNMELDSNPATDTVGTGTSTGTATTGSLTARKESQEDDDETLPEDTILDYNDDVFMNQFSDPTLEFQSVADLMTAINEYQDLSGNFLSTTRSRGVSRTFVCVSHTNCPFHVKFGPKAPRKGVIVYKPIFSNLQHRGVIITRTKMGRRHKKRCKHLLQQIVDDVVDHKEGLPTAKDLIEAGIHKKKTQLSYQQCYRGIRTWKTVKDGTDSMTFQLIGPYIQRFVDRNPGSTAIMEKGNDDRIKRIFVCPPFANEALTYVRPVMSLDAAPMKSEWKGTLYVASVKSATDEIYPIAFAIVADHRNDPSWDWFLEKLKASTPNLILPHPKPKCAYKLFTFMSNGAEDLIAALNKVFPDNHNCHCAAHIMKNVESRFGMKIANLATDLATIDSLPARATLLSQLQQKSPGAYAYLMDIPPDQWMDSAWLEDETLPPRYGIRTLNTSESTTTMFEEERRANWLDAMDRILKNLCLGIQTLSETYHGRTGVVEKVLAYATERWEKCVECKVAECGNDGRWFSVFQNRSGGCAVDTVNRVCDCGEWQAHGVPCVHGMAYFRLRLKLELEDVLQQYVEKYHTYENQIQLYSRNFVPVCIDMIKPDKKTLPPNGARSILDDNGKPKRVRLRLRSRFAHEPEKSPIVCSRCHQRGHNVKTCELREQIRNNAGNVAAGNRIKVSL
ncbi:MULE transposase domain containing protein [Nitzschia inconspicua]|uniref:MULE transposase domain containing protein n=1 Tax=Nitzschia inconspicua TaxID=303405 RepID=A0A9K3LTD3_9STRA|nr:MULE transposase domain containing protein [Nitzschia inconspicua]